MNMEILELKINLKHNKFVTDIFYKDKLFMGKEKELLKVSDNYIEEVKRIVESNYKKIKEVKNIE